MKSLLVSVLLGGSLALAASPAVADTLADVKARGTLNCGVAEALPGFSEKSDDGNWRGLDVDVCRAVAAAIFGDAAKVTYVPVAQSDGVESLRDKSIDLLANNRSWSLLLETSLNLTFASTAYFDGQGFMVDKKLGISSALELSGATVCTIPGTRQERGVAEYFASKKLPYKPVKLKESVEAVQAYEGERCIVLTGDVSWLHALRLTLSKPDDHMVLPERITNRPLGPIVRSDDNRWFKIVRWVVLATKEAEALGVTLANTSEMKESKDPRVRGFLGLEENLGSALGLSKDWAARVIAAVGNYGEIYERNLGEQSRFRIKRGPNALWKNGGLHIAPPVR